MPRHAPTATAGPAATAPGTHTARSALAAAGEWAPDCDYLYETTVHAPFSRSLYYT